ncbi:MAG: hypothetical protein AB9872_10005 [Solidesulfovibrio sp.]
MKRVLFSCFFLLFAASNALGTDLGQGFGKYQFGQSCQQLFKGPSFSIERARPVWDPKVQMFGLEYDPDKASDSKFILHYDKDEKPSFEGVPLGRVFYGCDKTTGRFSLVILSHDLLTVNQIVQKTTELLGEPTLTTMIQTIWALPELYVQIDQVYMIIYDRRAGKM